MSGPRRSAVGAQRGGPKRRTNRMVDPGDHRVWPQAEIHLLRESPGQGRHLVTIAQLRDFIALLPQWDEVAVGLDAIALVAFTQDVQGRSFVGSVELCAWEPDLWWEDLDPDFAAEHADVFDRLAIERSVVAGRLQVRFTEAQARAFQLLHVLPHELGHHHDRITNKTGWKAARGEPYAEAYAHQVMDAIWPAYLDRFGI